MYSTCVSSKLCEFIDDDDDGGGHDDDDDGGGICQR